MSESITKDDLKTALAATETRILQTTRQDLHDALATQTDVIKHELNDRFDHWEKRAVIREEKTHKEMTEGFGEIIENINNHADERFKEMSNRFDRVDTSLKDFNDRVGGVEQKHNQVAIVIDHPELKVA